MAHMEANMQLGEPQQRPGRAWPILFGLLGTLNLVDFFYKSAYQLDDILQGIGFLLIVPLAYFVPAAFSFTPRTHKLQISLLLKGSAMFGMLLVLFGFAVQWGWL